VTAPPFDFLRPWADAPRFFHHPFSGNFPNFPLVPPCHSSLFGFEPAHLQLLSREGACFLSVGLPHEVTESQPPFYHDEGPLPFPCFFPRYAVSIPPPPSGLGCCSQGESFGDPPLTDLPFPDVSYSLLRHKRCLLFRFSGGNSFLNIEQFLSIGHKRSLGAIHIIPFPFSGWNTWLITPPL